ncbi:two-component sensor histidine kinase [Nocardiopsis terrae]|uniref:Oxygen sensor histidine kinase NreB n=1 Tax=Nocardiopsis terrae TaxID=372655 RepID=A0ABR9HCP1_9ACTN|nr:sensor histidine kinase [Nocardiopsis terrae]MBE1456800.1 signal transduction histidine kinase [Nocardiopsis terrae]GHC75061.1 two-component sensor histidine kinase [Nocardiopsis terrae]
MRYGRGWAPELPGVVTVLRVLRLLLHACFLFLLGVGTARYALTGPAAAHPQWTHWAVGCGAALLAAVYCAGALAARHDVHRTRSLVWLAAVTLLWALLSWAAPDFVWLAFPLYFLHLHLLRGLHSVAAVVVITAAAVLGQVLHGGALTAGMVLGPVLGAVFAVAIAAGYTALDRESERSRELIDTLTRTRDELAAAQRRTGVLDERERLAREIHDTLAQGLSSIVLLLRTAESALPKDPGLAATRVAEARESASANLAEARRFVRDLAPPSLTGANLPDALRRLCERVGRTGGLDCRFRTDGTPAELPSGYEVALLRAAQASLANVTAHARATTAVVTLGYLGEEVTLDVYDDGEGFVPERLRPRQDGTGYGIASLRERVAALGGDLQVESAPGEGTAVAVRLPLTPEESR